jgi:hypothetical protein
MGKMVKCGDKMETWILKEKLSFPGLSIAPNIDKNRAAMIAHQPCSFAF